MCECFARCEADCVCDHDWTPPELTAARERIAVLEAERDQLRAELAECKQQAVRIYNSGYHAGHHDTVEGCYTHILPCDMSTYHDDVVAALAADDALREGGE